jgi:hypothetical protein
VKNLLTAIVKSLVDHPEIAIKFERAIVAMKKIATQTKLGPEEVIDRASKFFGKGGEGLEENMRNSCCISLKGGGGFVSASIYDGIKRTVDV